MFEYRKKETLPLRCFTYCLTRARQITQRFKGMNNGYGLTL